MIKLEVNWLKLGKNDQIRLQMIKLGWGMINSVSK